jgi:hypothetical protein
MQAQKTFTQSINTKNAKEVSFDLDFADDIIIEVWKKSEVFVEAVVNINANKHNDNFRFELKEIGDQIVLKAEIEDLDKIGEVTQIRDKEGDLYITNSRTVDLDITFKIKVPGDIAVALKTINGNIISKNIDNEIALKTISGEIDIAMDSKKSFDLIMKTITGDMFTDFEFEQPEKSKFIHIGGSIETEINGGGFPIELNTISGNIYFRKR